MSCWVTLGIEPFSDRTEIKRAYASKLKETRPDVDPEGFKRLHAAYQRALRSSPTAGIPSVPHVYAPVADESAGEEPEVPKPVDVVLASMRDPAEVSRLLVAHVDAALVDRRRAADPSSWLFVEQYDELDDVELRFEFSNFVFGRLLEGRDLVDPQGPAFAYLCDFFGWTECMDALAERYGDETVEAWLEPLEKRTAPTPSRWICPKRHPGPLEWGGYYARIGATLIDLSIGSAVLTLWFWSGSLLGLSDAPQIAVIILLTIPGYLLCSPVLEASPLQGTPGKVLMGLKVTTRTGMRANVLQTIWRVVVFAVSTAAFKITVWINFLIDDGRLLHDHLSATVVIKR